MSTVHVHIVEEEDLRGTKLSCVPGNRDPLPAGATITTLVFFATEEQLAQWVMRAFKAMLTSPDGDRHLLVLSAHGEPQTGTRIEVAPGEHVHLDRRPCDSCNVCGLRVSTRSYLPRSGGRFDGRPRPASELDVGSRVSHNLICVVYRRITWKSPTGENGGLRRRDRRSVSVQGPESRRTLTCRGGMVS